MVVEVDSAMILAPLDSHPKSEGSRQNFANSLDSHFAASKRPTLPSEALHGLAGRIVEGISPYSESDPVAILTNILVAFGNLIGPGPHFKVEHTKHSLNLFVAHVGNTSKARKGTAWSTPRYMFSCLEPEWVNSRITSGLSSGEGLIFALRDERIEKQPIKESGRVVDYQDVIVDHGVDDKRLLCVEEEFAQALKVMSRDGNILSMTLRQAWDGCDLTPLTKSNPIRASGAHVSVIAHITKDELLRHLNATEQTNGFANRFCWFYVERARLIDDPTGTPDEVLRPLVDDLRDAVAFAHTISEMKRDSDAAAIWSAVYPELSQAKRGLSGSILARGEAQVMRIASLYALLDQSVKIKSSHLNAGLALWEYSENSVYSIFGKLSGDPGFDKVHEALKAKGMLTLTQIHALFGRHVNKDEINRIVSRLLEAKIATPESLSSSNGTKAVTILKLRAN